MHLVQCQSSQTGDEAYSTERKDALLCAHRPERDDRLFSRRLHRVRRQRQEQRHPHGRTTVRRLRNSRKAKSQPIEDTGDSHGRNVAGVVLSVAPQTKIIFIDVFNPTTAIGGLGGNLRLQQLPPGMAPPSGIAVTTGGQYQGRGSCDFTLWDNDAVREASGGWCGCAVPVASLQICNADIQVTIRPRAPRSRCKATPGTARKGAYLKLRTGVIKALAVMLALAVIAVAALILLGLPAIRELFQHGEFTAYDAALTARLLSVYARLVWRHMSPPKCWCERC
jgi:hypothetical protein